MRILADENIPFPVVEALRLQGHDVAWVGEEKPGSTDVVAALRSRPDWEGHFSVITQGRIRMRPLKS